MDDIKKQLLSNLDDITTLFDYNNSNTQYITLRSKYEEYELIVDVVCYTKESIVEGNYHNDLKRFEGSGIVYDISSFKIKGIYTFESFDESDIEIKQYEVFEAISKQIDK